MIRALRTSRGIWLRAVVALLLVAVMVKGLIPTGYMIGSAPGHDTVALVLCTADGGVVADAPFKVADDPQHGSDAKTHDGLCVFAGHGPGAPPPSAEAIATVTFAAYAAPPVRRTTLTPGRGLAAPPLPARGPPSLQA